MQWPDFLTGLPDHAAVVRKVDEVYDKLGHYCVVYFRIDNIDPYLAKYGTDRHVEIIEWAAAILKTSIDNYKGFVGTVGTHEFLAVCLASDCEEIVETTRKAFRKRTRDFYRPDDLKEGAVLSFSTNVGKNIRLGLMDFKCCIADYNCDVSKDKFIPNLKEICC